jgi:uncharacterized protein (TIGR03067 family)
MAGWANRQSDQAGGTSWLLAAMPQASRGRRHKDRSLPMKKLLGPVVSLLFALVVCVNPVGAAAPSPNPASADAKAIQGTWKMVFAAGAGRALPQEEFAGHRLVFSGDKYTYFKEEDKLHDHGAFRLDPKARPRAIDIIEDQGPNRGTTSRGIYMLDGDTLVVCYNLPHMSRPTEFSSKADSSIFLFIYQRVRR